MNFLELHERLRLETWRRIDQGILSSSLLARRTGLAQAHISNFLHRRRRLSLTALNSVLLAQEMGVEDLSPPRHRTDRLCAATRTSFRSRDSHCCARRGHALATHPSQSGPGHPAPAPRLAHRIPPAPVGEPAQLGALCRRSRYRRPGSPHGSRPPRRFRRRSRPPLQLPRHPPSAVPQPLWRSRGHPSALPSRRLRIRSPGPASPCPGVSRRGNRASATGDARRSPRWPRLSLHF